MIPTPHGARPGMAMAMLKPLARALRRFGVDPDEFFRLIELPADSDAYAMASIYRVGSVLTELATKTKVPHLGLELARQAPVGALGVGDYTWASSSTFLDAMMRSHAHLATLTDGVQMELHILGASAHLRQLDKVKAHPQVLMEIGAVMLTQRMRHVLGSAAILEGVRFATAAPEATEPYDEFFGVKVEFGAGVNDLIFPLPLLQTPLLTADAELLHLLRAHARAQKAVATPADPLLAQASSMLAAMLEARDVDIDVGTLASRLEMATRSLQRKLGAQNTTFSELLDTARRERATRLLENENVLLADVAEQLGFADLSAFYRAFRRWTGASPRAFQKSRLA